ncbi:hypothetical protein EM6_2266 [Asticcacaulis excentricus]|uniref:Uncharacterized protein n=1 Tax=Asticcacaulis excentricus TaxID=78587 RepID=A0A3G9G955_9CAUL|nr:hypothetical protein EM6_2266 [Asticcacaulis excentricus]
MLQLNCHVFKSSLTALHLKKRFRGGKQHEGVIAPYAPHSGELPETCIHFFIARQSHDQTGLHHRPMPDSADNYRIISTLRF